MIVIAILVVVFFAMAFITKRRFGVLGPALIMGYVLYQSWQSDLPGWALAIGLPSSLIIAPVTLLGLVIVLLPSLVLLWGGPVYKSKYGRVLGSIGYGVLAVLICINPLVSSLALNAEGNANIELVMSYSKFIVTAAAVFAIIDMFYVHVGVPGKAKSSKH